MTDQSHPENSPPVEGSPRIVMMGAGPFAVPTFRALLENKWNVPALITRPNKAGPTRGKAPPPNPMRVVAEEFGLPVYEPESINSEEAHSLLTQLKADVLVVCDYGQILSSAALSTAVHGGINLHASLLPKYRGAAPINWAIYHGEKETGATVIHMTPHLDAGPCIGQVRTKIGAKENAVELEHRLSELGAPLVMRCLRELTSKRATSLPQDKTLATKARKLRKEDGEVDWSQSAEQIERQIRAFVPWPKTATFCHVKSRDPVRVILCAATALPVELSSPPGRLVPAERGILRVATGQGVLQIDRLQPSGKKEMTAADFLNGVPLSPDDRFGLGAA